MYRVSRLSASATIGNLIALRPGLVISLLATAGLLAPFLGAVFATPSSGLTTVPVARGTIAEDFKIHAHTDQLNVKIESKGPVDVVVNNNKLLPGGTVGWHSHTGPVIVLIRRGSMTLYDGADPDCTPKVFYAGEAFVENVTGDSAHTVRNEGTEDLEWTGTSFIPVGGVGRIDRPAPGNCPF
jgi:hypothetical protein